MTPMDQIRMQMHEIETRAGEIEILMQTIFLQIDSATDPQSALNAINCYATCALRNVALINEHRGHVMALTKQERGQP